MPGERTVLLKWSLSSLLVNGEKHGSSKHRGRLDIIADILNASSGKVRKTYLMYRCNLSFRQLKYYLEFLLKKKLLHVVADDEGSNPGLFKITRKGKEFLKIYKDLKILLE